MTDSPGKLITATATHHFPAAPEAVFDAWLDPALVRRWMAAALTESSPGAELTSVAIDARPGGTFTFLDSRDPDQHGPTGTYLHLDRPRRLVFTWQPEDGEHSVVTIDIEPTDTGSALTLVHEMESTWVDYVDRTAQAWARMVREIDAVLRA